MKNNKFLLNTLLAVVLFAALTAMVLIRALAPAVVLPVMNIPNMVLLSLAALLLEHLMAPNNPRCYVCVALFSIVTFGLLPLMAGFACIHDFWKYGLIGGGMFTLVTFLFSSMTDRLLTGPKARGAVFMGALGIWLAFQCFAGILL